MGLLSPDYKVYWVIYSTAKTASPCLGFWCFVAKWWVKHLTVWAVLEMYKRLPAFFVFVWVTPLKIHNIPCIFFGLHHWLLWYMFLATNDAKWLLACPAKPQISKVCCEPWIVKNSNLIITDIVFPHVNMAANIKNWSIDTGTRNMKSLYVWGALID